mmetsp:Transcript_19089/g.48203  ORF Transcript_19089/g.48203 Transcript_19089/m.48203 type:complete len:273 (-) Transcript_19089:601-1419(-)
MGAWASQVPCPSSDSTCANSACACALASSAASISMSSCSSRPGPGLAAPTLLFGEVRLNKVSWQSSSDSSSVSLADSSGPAAAAAPPSPWPLPPSSCLAEREAAAAEAAALTIATMLGNSNILPSSSSSSSCSSSSSSWLENVSTSGSCRMGAEPAMGIVTSADPMGVARAALPATLPPWLLPGRSRTLPPAGVYFVRMLPESLVFFAPTCGASFLNGDVAVRLLDGDVRGTSPLLVVGDLPRGEAGRTPACGKYAPLQRAKLLVSRQGSSQ